MGHLLSSVNPEAAAAIQPPVGKPRLPQVGEIVIYHMRLGHTRQGRTRFPALVQGSNEREQLNLTVILEAGELLNATLVDEIGPGKDTGHVWERPDTNFLAAGLHGTIASLHQRIGGVEDLIAELRKIVLGDFDVPRISIIDIMQDFENRLRLKAAPAAPAAVDAAPAPKKPRKPRFDKGRTKAGRKAMMGRPRKRAGA